MSHLSTSYVATDSHFQVTICQDERRWDLGQSEVVLRPIIIKLDQVYNSTMKEEIDK